MIADEFADEFAEMIAEQLADVVCRTVCSPSLQHSSHLSPTTRQQSRMPTKQNATAQNKQSSNKPASIQISNMVPFPNLTSNHHKAHTDWRHGSAGDSHSGPSYSRRPRHAGLLYVACSRPPF